MVQFRYLGFSFTISFCFLILANITIVLALSVILLNFRAYFPYFPSEFALHRIALLAQYCVVKHNYYNVFRYLAKSGLVSIF